MSFIQKPKYYLLNVLNLHLRKKGLPGPRQKLIHVQAKEIIYVQENHDAITSNVFHGCVSDATARSPLFSLMPAKPRLSRDCVSFKLLEKIPCSVE